MLGAIAGDMIGSPYERSPIKTMDFPLFSQRSTFTDDSVMTCAVADALLDGGDYIEAFHRYFHMYPNAGYGNSFFDWAMRRDRRPYGSYGNGSAMRVSPVGWVLDSLEEALAEAKKTAIVTHDHPEGIKGAQATAAAIYLYRTGSSSEEVAQFIEQGFGYSLDQPLANLRPSYSFDVTCQGTVPVAIRSVLEARDWEDAVRLAVSMGGDSDTLGCIAGSIAEARFGLPDEIAEETLRRLEAYAPPLHEITEAFRAEYCV